MGASMITHAEKRNEQGEWTVIPYLRPFNDWSLSSRMFGWIADVRNYSAVPPLAECRGLPEDVSEEIKDENDCSDTYGRTWFSLDEFLNFDYGAQVEDRRVTALNEYRAMDGACTCETGQGEIMTWRDFLGGEFDKELEKLKQLKVERIIFWFW